MNTPFALIALCACVVSLGACDKAPSTPPTPMVNQLAQAESGATAASVADQTVLSTESAFSSANATKADAAPG